MEYREQKDRRKKIKRRRWTSLIIVFVVIAIAAVSFIFPPDTWKYRVAKPKIGTRENGCIFFRWGRVIAR